MAKMLVHIHTGPSDPTKLTLGCLIAATALKDGHSVDVFLAGDGVYAFDPKIREETEGFGTGKLLDHLSAIEAGGGRFYLSQRSSEARGYDDSLLAGFTASFALPSDLVRLSTEADTVLCY